MANNVRHGKYSRLSVSGTFLCCTDANFNHNGERIETTCFEDNGIITYIMGIIKLEWSLTSMWQPDKVPTQSPPALYPRDDGTQMTYYVNRQDNSRYNLPTWVCGSAATKSSVRSFVEFTASGVTTGTFSVPAQGGTYTPDYASGIIGG